MENQGGPAPEDLQENQEDQCQVGLDLLDLLDVLVLQEREETQVQSPKTSRRRENPENQVRLELWDPKEPKDNQDSSVELDLRDKSESQDTRASVENQAPLERKVFQVPVPVLRLICEVLLETLDLRALMDPEEVLDRLDSEES